MPFSQIVEIHSMNDLEKNELLDMLPEGSVQFTSVELEKDHYHGDPATIVAIIVGSIATYKAIALWLTRNKKKSNFKKTITVKSGTEEVQSVLEYSSSELSSDADVIRELSNLFKVEPSTLAKALEEA
jgi:hypothetical protein